jgi:hypothetical protein
LICQTSQAKQKQIKQDKAGQSRTLTNPNGQTRTNVDTLETPRKHQHQILLQSVG